MIMMIFSIKCEDILHLLSFNEPDLVNCLTRHEYLSNTNREMIEFNAVLKGESSLQDHIFK